MQASLLDLDALDQTDDIDMAPLLQLLPDLKIYRHTTTRQALERLRRDEIIITNKVVINGELMRQLPSLKLICVAATGVNNIDIEAAKELGIAVANVTGYATPSVVQHVFALITALQTRLPEYTRDVRQGVWQRSPLFCLLNYPIREMEGLTFGIIGYGELGKAVASVGRAFGMEILISQRPGGDPTPGRVPLENLLRASDIVSLHCPLAENTRNLIDEAALSLMKPDALLINTARGGIVDEVALADALRSEKIGGAGFDVLTSEPPNDNPLLAPDLPNFLLTPHIAWASRESRQRLIDELAANIDSFMAEISRNRIV